MLEKAVHIDNLMQTIIMAQKKSDEKKRLNDDVKTQPPLKRRSIPNLENRDSVGSIDSETLMECIEEVDNETMRLDNDVNLMDEKPDSADKTLLGDLGMLPLPRDNESNSVIDKNVKIEYVTNDDLNQ